MAMNKSWAKTNWHNVMKVCNSHGILQIPSCAFFSGIEKLSVTLEVCIFLLFHKILQMQSLGLEKESRKQSWKSHRTLYNECIYKYNTNLGIVAHAPCNGGDRVDTVSPSSD